VSKAIKKVIDKSKPLKRAEIEKFALKHSENSSTIAGVSLPKDAHQRFEELMSLKKNRDRNS
jgi:hypothetical protein